MGHSIQHSSRISELLNIMKGGPPPKWKTNRKPEGIPVTKAIRDHCAKLLRRRRDDGGNKGRDFEIDLDETIK